MAEEQPPRPELPEHAQFPGDPFLPGPPLEVLREALRQAAELALDARERLLGLRQALDADIAALTTAGYTTEEAQRRGRLLADREALLAADTALKKLVYDALEVLNPKPLPFL